MKIENLLIILRVAVPEAVVACSRKTPCVERIGLFVPLVTGREPEGGEGGGCGAQLRGSIRRWIPSRFCESFFSVAYNKKGEVELYIAIGFGIAVFRQTLCFD